MRKLKIYLDTSVISHLDAPDALKEMNDTLKLWADIKAGMYTACISDLTIAELTSCPEPKRSEMFTRLTDVEHIELLQDERAEQLAVKPVIF